MQVSEPSFRLLEDVAAWIIGQAQWSLDELRLDAADFPWAESLVAARMHGLAPALGVYLTEMDLWLITPEPVREILTELKRNSDHRASIFTSVAAEVVLALEREGIAVAVRKGLITRHLLYSARSVRGFDDIDLLVQPEAARAAEAVLGGLGFRPGRLNRRSEQIARLSNEEIRRIHSNSDHLINYARPTGDRAVPAVPVDVALSFTWANSEYRMDVGKALDARRMFDAEGTGLPRLDDQHMFVDCLMHLFRDAFLETGIRRGDDITLIKFVEVALFVRKIGTNPEDLVRTRELFELHNLQSAIAWVLAHTDSLFRLGATELFGVQTVASNSFLHAFRRSDGVTKNWPGTIRSRLQDRQMMMGLLNA
jgi:hypothetical protein